MNRSLFLLLAAGLLLVAPPAGAWFTGGHHQVAESAVGVLPPSLPEFFRRGGATVAHASVDPDLFKDRTQPQLRDQESPDHYLDLELLDGRPLPPTRYEFLALVQWLAAEPAPAGYRVTGAAAVGVLPYAVVEGTQRLTLAFAEHRRWPDNPHVRAKALQWAGELAHYAGDLSQPLHTSVHHDGRAQPDGTSPHTGIHQRVDGLFERVGFDRAAAVEGISLEFYSDLFAGVRREFAASHAELDRVYALEPQLDPAADGFPSAETLQFTRERYRAATRFIASLFLTAWERSAEVELPGWLVRE